MGLFGPPEYLKCCCGGSCRVPCCPDAEFVSSIFTFNDIGPGALGCPEYETNPVVPEPFEVTSCTPPEEIVAEFDQPICRAFCLTTSQSVPGSVGNFAYEIVVLCFGNGSSTTAFIKYLSGASLLGLPSGVWIETAGGFTCPDCGPEDTGESKTATLWYDVFVNCGVCNAALINYETELPCSPNTIFSVRHYFTSAATCL